MQIERAEDLRSAEGVEDSVRAGDWEFANDINVVEVSVPPMMQILSLALSMMTRELDRGWRVCRIRPTARKGLMAALI